MTDKTEIKPGDQYLIGLDKSALGPRLAEFSGKIVEITTVFESRGKVCASFVHRHIGVGAAFVVSGLFRPVTAEDIAMIEKRIADTMAILENAEDPMEGAQALAAAGFVKQMGWEDADQAIQGVVAGLDLDQRRDILKALGWSI